MSLIIDKLTKTNHAGIVTLHSKNEEAIKHLTRLRETILSPIHKEKLTQIEPSFETLATYIERGKVHLIVTSKNPRNMQPLEYITSLFAQEPLPFNTQVIRYTEREKVIKKAVKKDTQLAKSVVHTNKELPSVLRALTGSKIITDVLYPGGDRIHFQLAREQEGFIPAKEMATIKKAIYNRLSTKGYGEKEDWARFIKGVLSEHLSLLDKGTIDVSQLAPERKAAQFLDKRYYEQDTDKVCEAIEEKVSGIAGGAIQEKLNQGFDKNTDFPGYYRQLELRII